MERKMPDHEKGFFVKYMIATLCLISILAIFLGHFRYMDQKISDISKVYLSKISLQNAGIISNEIHTNLQTLNVIARMVGSSEGLSLEKINAMLQAEARSSSFISLGVVLNDGRLTFTPVSNGETGGKAAHSGEEINGARLLLSVDWNDIDRIMSGKSEISGSPSRKVNDKTVNMHAVPIDRGGTTGVLVAFFDEAFFKGFLIPDTMDWNGCSYVADKNGNIIFHSKSCGADEVFSSAMESLSRGWSLEGKEGMKLRGDIENGRLDTIEYKLGNQGIYISYAPIDFHDWYLITLTDSAVAEAQSKSIYDEIIPAFLYLLIIIMAVAVYLVYMRNQSFRRLERRMEIESISDESYRMIMEQTDDIIFEYDTLDKTYFHTDNFRKTFGYEPTKTGFLGSLEYDYIHPDDIARFVELYERMRQDRKLAETEVRIIDSEGKYLWARVYMLGVFDRDGRLAKVIGKIVNIDEKKKEIQHLKQMAATDTATGVYNKQTTANMIKDFLSGDGRHGKHAMMVIDMDNFKGINDCYGHLVGDAVLSAMGIELNHLFRADDIKGRIGGDEFMILMKDADDPDLIGSKAAKICRMFQDYELDENIRIDVSSSVGISQYDMDGATYEALYEAADRALYYCKNKQKGTYAFCREADGETVLR